MKSDLLEPKKKGKLQIRLYILVWYTFRHLNNCILALKPIGHHACLRGNLSIGHIFW